ncbi:MAG: hypothetical protein FJ096_02050 [Deltaproteobacteria bacterium]|nr:hypothetical protein [Deltaproteobacteria bacterium]
MTRLHLLGLAAAGLTPFFFAGACGSTDATSPTGSGATTATTSAGATASVTSGSGGVGGAGATDDGLPEDEPDDTSSSSSGSMLDGTEPPALPLDHPGGWAKSTLVFSEAKMVLDEEDNERVQLGWIELNSTANAPACGGDGPKAVRTFYSWTHGGYEPGDCPSDKKDKVDFARWDHVGPDLVDNCPGKDAWLEDGKPATRPFLFDCPAHVTSGFGDPAARTKYVGHYQYDPANRTLVFRYDVDGQCRKEYLRDLTLDKTGKLLGAVLDGVKTGDTSSKSRGLGNTLGYAFASSTPIGTGASFAETTEALRTRTFLADAYRFRESRKLNPPQPEHHHENSAVGFKPENCKPTVAFDHACGEPDPGDPPYLKECASTPKPSTAFLRWLVAPFQKTSPREHLYWGWFARHAPSWTGCYHRGSHANPALQVVDSDGNFRGYVGVEMQRAAATEQTNSGYIDDPDNHLDTDYRTWRWVEASFEPILKP